MICTLSGKDTLFAVFIVTFLMLKEVYQRDHYGKQQFSPGFFTDGVMLELFFFSL